MQATFVFEEVRKTWKIKNSKNPHPAVFIYHENDFFPPFSRRHCPKIFPFLHDDLFPARCV